MPNKTITLLEARMKKRGYKMDNVSPAAVILCDIMDEFNEQHWHDRNAYHERIKKLESELHRLKTQGQAE